jgi:preprotein translocase subunit SecF
MENLVKHRYWWFALSLILILPGLYFLLLNPLITTGKLEPGLRPSIDFSGGALWEIHLPNRTREQINTEEMTGVFAESGFEGARVQVTTFEIGDTQMAAAVVRTIALGLQSSVEEQRRVEANLKEAYGEDVRLERVDSVGPTVSQESTRSAIIAVAGASLAILVYLTLAFRKAPHPVRYGMCAIIAMLHDVILILGIAAILGAFFEVEVDALFLTAVLTILSFSVHDSIVVFDRIRENLINRRPGEAFEQVVNHSIVQTLPRSINTQLTTLFTLTALLLFGGDSIRNFVAILLVGLISGTYSSIFNAAQILVVWENREWKTWFRRGSSSEKTATSS